MTTQSTPAPASAEAPRQISERTRARMQEAYRMIHAIAARSEEEERQSAEEAASAEARAQKEAVASPSTEIATAS